MPAPDVPPTSVWDVFCRVIDNWGDIGVSWRLARGLAARGQQVRLWVDDASALAWMAPQGWPGVSVHPWQQAVMAPPRPGQVVVETFGCDPPEAFVARMAAEASPPVWVNLEYLSAEAYVARSHRLASPRFTEPGRGLMKWFYFPGFTAQTGGLLRDADGAATPPPWGNGSLPQAAAPQAGEWPVSLFCYPDPPALAALCQALAGQPVVWLTAPGAAHSALSQQTLPHRHRHVALPWLAQPDYDGLLQACAFNLVRGEDSFVQAQWAGQPFLWHIYPQHDGAHGPKLAAFLERHLAGAPAELAALLRAWMLAWNGLGPVPAALPAAADWLTQVKHWRAGLQAQADLVSQLLEFVAEKR